MFFIEHIATALIYSILAGSLIASGVLVAQLVDVDHTGSARDKINCAIHNDTDHCYPSKLLYRGFLHHWKALVIATALFLFILGLYMGYILHLLADQIILFESGF